MYTIKEIEKLDTVKELTVVAKELEITGISKKTKIQLKDEIIQKVKKALKGLPVDGPTAVLEAVEAIEALIPDYFEASEDKSSKTIPHLTRRLGEPLASGTIVLHVDFGRAGHKKPRVLIMEKCHGQKNASHHIFSVDEPEVIVNYLNILKASRK